VHFRLMDRAGNDFHCVGALFLAPDAA
jgi:hypothetical protein